MAGREWVNVGTVVDSVGSSGRKITYQGKDYDYVFDVDIEDGKPALKLPYNLSQNPYEVARKFIEDNELPISYLDQVTNFIVTNTQGATLGQSSGSNTQAPGSDPWGTESRYRPGDVGAYSSQQQPTARPKILPQTQYLTITNANVKMIHKKILEFNQQLIESGSKDLSMNPSDLDVLADLVRQLEQPASSSARAASPAGIDIVLKLATAWPQDKRLPGLDLLRLQAAASAALVTRTSSGTSTLLDALAASGVFSASAPPNNAMLAARALANLAATDEGRLLLDGGFDRVRAAALAPLLAAAPALLRQNRNLAVALATVYVNYAVLLKPAGEAGADRALALMEDLVVLLGATEDAEALYRALVALGTVLALGIDVVKEAAVSVFEVKALTEKVEGVGKEPRIKNVGREIRELL
jgi:phospholipase A-2-activating protein